MASEVHNETHLEILNGTGHVSEHNCSINYLSLIVTVSFVGNLPRAISFYTKKATDLTPSYGISKWNLICAHQQ